MSFEHVSLRLPKILKQTIEKIAKNNERSLSAQIRKDLTTIYKGKEND